MERRRRRRSASHRGPGSFPIALPLSAVLLACLAPLLSSCKDDSTARARSSLQSRYEEISAGAAPLLANLEAIKRACANLPEAEAAAPITPDGAPLVRSISRRNLFYVHSSDLTAMVYRKAAPDLEDIHPWINITEELARAKKALATPEGSIPYFPLVDAWKSFREVEYVLVVRGAYVAPTARGDATFEPGAFLGDAQLFSLKTGKHLGGFPLRVASSAQIDVRYRAAHEYNDIRSDLMKDLTSKVLLSIRSSLESATRQKLD